MAVGSPAGGCTAGAAGAAGGVGAAGAAGGLITYALPHPGHWKRPPDTLIGKTVLQALQVRFRTELMSGMPVLRAFPPDGNAALLSGGRLAPVAEHLLHLDEPDFLVELVVEVGCLSAGEKTPVGRGDR